ncbi:hypothetical protein LCGC14_2093190, partial [marine sediment metagenome]
MCIRPSNRLRVRLPVRLGIVLGAVFVLPASRSVAVAADPQATSVKTCLRFDLPDEEDNLLKPDRWELHHSGFEREASVLVCDNGEEVQAQRGAGQTVELNQETPRPIHATGWSKAVAVTGSPDLDYSIYLDLTFTDGTHLWGRAAPFSIGTHDWEFRQVVVIPEKPVRTVSFYVLLRGHGGKARFRDLRLSEYAVPSTASVFDGCAVLPKDDLPEGFQIRDVAKETDFFRIETESLDLKLDCRETEGEGATFFDVTLSSLGDKDRAVTLYYTIPLGRENLRWLEDPRRDVPVAPRREYINATNYRVGANGRLSRYPFAAVADRQQGVGLGIDMSRPAFFRVGYNSGTGELFLAYDIGLTREKPTARVRFCKFAFEPQWGFRAALARFYELFPDHFRCRTPEQGLWMPFARISQVEDWEDFGFRFKEGSNETAWDDAHGILTFRYTEPMTWWMPMGPNLPRTTEAAEAEVRRLAEENNDARAKALLAAGFRDPDNRLVAQFRDTPWCNGAAWSMNSMPGITGEATDFKLKWNQTIRRRLYGPG